MLKRLFLLCLIPFGLLLAAPHAVQAASVDYQVYKYGTSERSLASQYYVQPAKVQANNGQYLVTMTIHTKTSLGKWPVTVLSIDNQGPANVTKTKTASGYDYSYAFETKDLSQVVNSSININVLHVYAAQQKVSFQFDTRQLPKLTAKAGATTAQASKAATAAQKKATKAMEAKNKQLAKQIRAVNRERKQTQQTVLISGGVSVALLAVAAYFFVKRR